MSHYCEKGRWALDHARIPYVESGHAPALHLPHVVRRRSETTPVLDLPGGGTLRGSDAILDYATAHGASDLMPEDAAERDEVRRWLTIADERLGPQTRRWFYSWALSDPALLTAMAKVSAPSWERAAVSVSRPVIGLLIARRFAVDADTRAESAALVRAVFAEADAAREPGSPYLVGGRFTAADLAFAALAAPVLFADGYGPPDALTEADLPAAMLADVEAWRSEPTGNAVLDVYAAHRRPSGQFAG